MRKQRGLGGVSYRHGVLDTLEREENAGRMGDVSYTDTGVQDTQEGEQRVMEKGWKCPQTSVFQGERKGVLLLLGTTFPHCCHQKGKREPPLSPVPLP